MSRPCHRCALLVASCAAVVACSSSSGRAAGTSGSTTGPPVSASSATTARVPSTTTTTALVTTTTAAPPKVGFPTPRAALEHLLGALPSNDRVGAAQGAEPAAVDALFALQGKALRIYQCDTAEFMTSGCTIRAADGTGQVNMAKRPEGWIVTSLFWSPA